MAQIAADEDATSVDITAIIEYVQRVERLESPRPVLVSVDLAPGLTNLLTASVYETAPGPIDLAVMLGAGERDGKRASAMSYRLLGRRFRDTASGDLVPNYTRGRVFGLPG